MKFKLEIQCDNAAFEDAPELETARLLREAAHRIQRGEKRVRLRDVNGNHVGEGGFEE